MPGSGSERLHALDAVRAFALLAGIAFHATLSFLPSAPGVSLWIVMDTHRSVALSILFYVLHNFRLMTFFFIAGFFGRMSFHRMGVRAFLGDRLKRIAVPLIVGWIVLFPAIVAVSIWGALVMYPGKPLPPPPTASFPAFPLTHLWFLYVLLWFYAAVLIVRGLVVVIDRRGRLRAGLDALVRGAVRVHLAPLLLAAPACAALYLLPNWMMWFGIPTPDSSLVPNLPAVAGFGTAFAFGWLAQRDPGLLEIWRRRWPLNLLLAAGLTIAALMAVGLTPLLAPARPGAATLAYALCYTLAQWAWTFAFVGMALRFLSGFSAVRRYIADASYWLYLIHLPIVMALQVAVSRLDWPWGLKFGGILAVAIPLMLVTYSLFVRNTFIGAILNGRRKPHSLSGNVAASTFTPQEG